ncbi:tRNA(Ile)-lysidine synthase [Candidatus Photodesmus blepharus]|uniref:tRNA(Ile)-lysidine synthase n=1 Tax=Candidatus Photodesmus blepharonis TaxID=1179155 RepID=A0A084CNZ1_9GAMM|nr:tRNA lysidine(34) synthetase TilS [Candidatus Photodesmus blepharus]KEY91520.1 tRNA(Ile)-lysidine synthase [Candidatus Photodesmus blepharus]
MSRLYDHFSRIIDKYYNLGTKIVLGFSGGVDSLVMLDLLVQYRNAKRIDCIAVHVHHNLSQFSDNWANQCLNWCTNLSITCYVERIELNTLGVVSLEKVAREGRHQALKKHVEIGDLLLTGHHSDDQLETFFLALKRGSGPRGLSSMAQCMPWNSGFIVRPFLNITRSLIEQYAKQKKFSWIEDESNNDTRFDRNFIRHRVLPVIVERWPSFHKSVNRSAMLCAEQENLLDDLLASSFQNAMSVDGSLSIRTLGEYSEVVRNRVIRMWFKSKDYLMPSKDHLSRIWNEIALSRRDANPVLNLVDAQVRRFKKKLYLVNHMQDISAWSAPLKLGGSVKLPDSLGYLSLVNGEGATLSFKALSQQTLSVIFNPAGLSAHPVERGCSRKLKKLFQEYELPSWLRRRVPILVSASYKVVAVAGVFVDKKFYGQDCKLIWNK